MSFKTLRKTATVRVTGSRVRILVGRGVSQRTVQLETVCVLQNLNSLRCHFRLGSTVLLLNFFLMLLHGMYD
jgi:hypothetical protein